MKHKTWDDNVLFYGGEILFLLIAEGYIAVNTYEGPQSLPFCLGLMITALVAAVGMHWALTKLSKKLMGGGYFVWLGITLLVGFTACVLWMANDRRKEHEKSLGEQKATLQQKTDLEIEKETHAAQNQITNNVAIMASLEPLLKNAKTQAEKKRILETAKGMLVAQATPTPDLAAQVAAAISPAKKADITAIKAWQPFEEGTFLEFWYHQMTRFCSLMGIAGIAILLGLFIVYNNEETALRHAQSTALTTTTVTTNGPVHAQVSEQAPLPVQQVYQHPVHRPQPVPSMTLEPGFASGVRPQNQGTMYTYPNQQQQPPNSPTHQQ